MEKAITKTAEFVIGKSRKRTGKWFYKKQQKVKNNTTS